jgi:hypothetical protein
LPTERRAVVFLADVGPRLWRAAPPKGPVLTLVWRAEPEVLQHMMTAHALLARSHASPTPRRSPASEPAARVLMA